MWQLHQQSVACGEGCARMLHGASGLGVARGRNKKGTGVPATLRRCMLVTLARVYRRLHGKASKVPYTGGRRGRDASAGMLASHDEVCEPGGSPNAKCSFFVPFFFCLVNCSIKDAARPDSRKVATVRQNGPPL